MKNSVACVIFAVVALIALAASGDTVYTICLFVSVCAAQICSAIENRGEK